MTRPSTVQPNSVSVIVPCYNASAFVGQVIDNILDSTYRPVEVVVVDDGSVDQTAEEAGRHPAPEVRVIRAEHGGLAHARNRGLEGCHGAFVQFLDADDAITQDKLAHQVQYLRENPDIDAVYGRVVRYNVDTLECRPDTSCRHHQPAWDPVFAFLRENVFDVHAPLFRRQIFEGVGGFNEALHARQDCELYLRMAMAGHRFAFEERVVGMYRIHTSQKSRRSFEMAANTDFLFSWARTKLGPEGATRHHLDLAELYYRGLLLTRLADAPRLLEEQDARFGELLRRELARGFSQNCCAYDLHLTAIAEMLLNCLRLVSLLSENTCETILGSLRTILHTLTETGFEATCNAVDNLACSLPQLMRIRSLVPDDLVATARQLRQQLHTHRVDREIQKIGHGMAPELSQRHGHGTSGTLPPASRFAALHDQALVSQSLLAAASLGGLPPSARNDLPELALLELEMDWRFRKPDTPPPPAEWACRLLRAANRVSEKRCSELNDHFCNFASRLLSELILAPEADLPPGTEEALLRVWQRLGLENAYAEACAKASRYFLEQGRHRNVALYGGGAFTRRILLLAKDGLPEVAAVADDNPALHGTFLAQRPIVPLKDAVAGADAVLVGSDRWYRQMKKRVDAVAPRNLPIYCPVTDVRKELIPS